MQVSDLLLNVGFHSLVIHPPDKSLMSTNGASSLSFSVAASESAVTPDESWFCVASVSVRALMVCWYMYGEGLQACDRQTACGKASRAAYLMQITDPTFAEAPNDVGRLEHTCTVEGKSQLLTGGKTVINTVINTSSHHLTLHVQNRSFRRQPDECPSPHGALYQGGRGRDEEIVSTRTRIHARPLGPSDR